MNYTVHVLRSTEKDIDHLHPTIYNRIIKKLLLLEENPRPRGLKKLSGREEYRLRVGDYRILYTVDDENHSIEVSAIGRRRDVYG